MSTKLERIAVVMKRQVEHLIFDWNDHQVESSYLRPVTLLDESLRDGIQSPSVVDPSIDDKIKLLHYMEQLGVQYITLGFPAASKRAYEDVLALTQEIVEHGMQIRPTCAARTVEKDIEPILEISAETGVPIEVMTFIGSSPLRSLIEAWDEELLAQRTEAAIRLAVKAGNPVTYITEDTSRSRPETLERLFTVALENGAKGICLCDTVGHATPEGVRSLIGFTRRIIDQVGTAAQIDWHGHNDRGLALPNAIAAIEAGADRIHTTVLGIGERCGNTPLEQLLINLKLENHWSHELLSLQPLVDLASKAMQVPIPVNYPGMGRDAFRTASGIHASAIIKASKRRKQTHLVDLMYSGVPAAMLGREQEIDISHMSGTSNVIYWLERHGYEAKPEVVNAILYLAKSMNRVLTVHDIITAINLHAGHPQGENVIPAHFHRKIGYSSHAI